MNLTGFVPGEAVICDQDGGHAETTKIIILNNCFAPGSDEKAPGFGAGYKAMADVDPGCPGNVLYYICQPNFPGHGPGKGDADLSWGYPFRGFDNSILLNQEGARPDKSDGVSGIVSHKAIGLRVHVPQDQLISRGFADDPEVNAMYIYGVVMHTIEAATIDRYKAFAAGKVHPVRKRRDHPAATQCGFDEYLVHRDILRELGNNAQPMHIPHAYIFPPYILTVDQESADLIAHGIPNSKYAAGRKPGTIVGPGEMQHAGRGFGYHRPEQTIIFVIGVKEGMGSVDPDTEMVLCYPIFPIPGEPATVDAMPGVGMDPDVDGGVRSAGHREFGHGGTGEIFGEVRQGQTITMIYHHRGHLPMKDQKAAVTFYPEVSDAFE